MMLPDMSARPSEVESYRYAGVNGLPYSGDPGLLNELEYVNRAVLTVRAGFGNFDTADTEQEHFGRTLHQILTKVAAGHYGIKYQSHQWIRCETKGVRILYFLHWVEYIERDRQEAVQLTSRQTIHSLNNSR